MSRSKHTEAQMIAAVKQMEAGRKAEDVAREVGVSTHTIYAWKSKYGGMDVSEAQEAKRLRDENARLRKLVADLSLDKDALQYVIEKKRLEFTAMKASVEQLQAKYAFTERRACLLLLVPISSFRYKPRQSNDDLKERLIALAREKPRYGYRRLHVLLEREGEHVNHKRVHRIYCEAGLALRRKKRKHCVRTCAPLGVCTAANQEWALDFVHDVTASGRSIRVLNVIDAYTRESLAMEVDTSFAGLRLTRVLDGIIAERGLPQAIRCDNGPELTSRHFLA